MKGGQGRSREADLECCFLELHGLLGTIALAFVSPDVGQSRIANLSGVINVVE